MIEPLRSILSRLLRTVPQKERGASTTSLHPKLEHYGRSA
jgi:hypothetical protein